MEANELRIGNWVQMLDGSKFQITSVDFSAIEITPEYLRPKPIPLTPEILEMADVVKCYGGGHEWWNLCKNGWLKIYQHPFGFIVTVGGSSLNAIHYLHQLQNLIFALTGQELTIDLNH